jgi:hypothetical protein
MSWQFADTDTGDTAASPLPLEQLTATGTTAADETQAAAASPLPLEQLTATAAGGPSPPQPLEDLALAGGSREGAGSGVAPMPLDRLPSAEGAAALSPADELPPPPSTRSKKA